MSNRYTFQQRLQFASEHWANSMAAALQDGQKIAGFMVARFEDLLTSREAAEVLGLTPAGLRRKARLGQLEAVKRGGVWWFLSESVEQYAEKVEGKARHDPTRGREEMQPE